MVRRLLIFLVPLLWGCYRCPPVMRETPVAEVLKKHATQIKDFGFSWILDENDSTEILNSGFKGRYFAKRVTGYETDSKMARNDSRIDITFKNSRKPISFLVSDPNAVKQFLFSEPFYQNDISSFVIRYNIDRIGIRAVGAPTVIASGADTGGDATITTGSQTVSDDALVMLITCNVSPFDANPGAPTDTWANSGSWTTYEVDASDTYNSYITVSYMQISGSGGSGAASITLANNAPMACWGFFEWTTGFDATTPESEEAQNTSTSSPLTVTFSDLSSDNYAIVGFMSNTSGITPDASYTELIDVLASSALDVTLEVEGANTTDTACTATDLGGENGGIGIEVAAAAEAEAGGAKHGRVIIIN